MSSSEANPAPIPSTWKHTTPSIQIWLENQSFTTYGDKEYTDICRWGPTLHTETTLVFEDKFTVPEVHWTGFWDWFRVQVWVGQRVWIFPWCERMAIIVIISIQFSLLPSCSVTSVSTAAHCSRDQFSSPSAHAPHTHTKVRHICHSSASFDLIITINLYQEQVTVLLRFKRTHPMAICSLSRGQFDAEGQRRTCGC